MPRRIHIVTRYFKYGLDCIYTECPKINRKSVLHLLRYTENIYLSRCSTNLRQLLGHSVHTLHSLWEATKKVLFNLKRCQIYWNVHIYLERRFSASESFFRSSGGSETSRTSLISVSSSCTQSAYIFGFRLSHTYTINRYLALFQ